MCLVALAVDQDRRFPLVIAANRDEFHARPTSRLGWWTPGDGAPAILSGRDLSAGGTWLGLTAAGRLALVTNVRRPGVADPQAPSRGHIVPLWLRGDLSADRFWMRVALSGFNPFNLIAADFRRGEVFLGQRRIALPAPHRAHDRRAVECRTGHALAQGRAHQAPAARGGAGRAARRFAGGAALRGAGRSFRGRRRCAALHRHPAAARAAPFQRLRAARRTAPTAPAARRW
jgi:hypothetical protein